MSATILRAIVLAVFSTQKSRIARVDVAASFVMKDIKDTTEAPLGYA